MKNILLTILATVFTFSGFSQNTFYGTTEGGGAGGGTIFSVLSDGTNHQLEYTWEQKGRYPAYFNKMVEVSSGIFYGITENGGSSNRGVIYRYDVSTSTYTKVHDFETTTGQNPRGFLTLASNGKLYGTTGGGGANGVGVLYEFDPATSTYTVLLNFSQANGKQPQEGVYETGGKLYGTAGAGGNSDMGVLYEYDISTASYTILHHFNNTVGKYPSVAPILASNGKFYGTAAGGANNGGTIYEYDPSIPSITKLFDLNATDGLYVTGRMIEVAGVLYGLARSGGSAYRGTIFEFDPGTNTYTKKVDLSYSKGANPDGSMTYLAGKFYFLTASGGPSSGGSLIEYNLSTNSITSLVDFGYTNNKGHSPHGNLTLGSNGKFYGSTYSGGVGGNGVLFEYDLANDIYSILEDFNNLNGEAPWSGLVLGPNNKLYGTTTKGGANGEGVIYSFDSNTKTFTKLFDFSQTDGRGALGTGIIIGNKLIGFTNSGGQYGYGGIYEFDITTNVYTVLKHLQSSSGYSLQGEPVYLNGKIYAAAGAGGSSGAGTIIEFDITTSSLSVKHNFTSATGYYPKAGLMLSSNGKLYGSTQVGSLGGGVIYEFDPDNGNYLVKYDFNNQGSRPESKLYEAANGKLYGMTYNNNSLFEFDLTSNTYTRKVVLAGLYQGTSEGSLFESSPGVLLGMTSSSPAGYGTIFRYNYLTNTYTKTLEFNVTNGYYPRKTFITSSTFTLVDNDADGYMNDVDCDDNLASVYPFATELDDGIDNNCNGTIDEGFDLDADGYSSGQGDCDDGDPAINPGAAEVADGIDNNCDGLIDDGTDADSDGYYAEYGDCDDNSASINPGATDIAGSGIDANCDGNYLWYVDADGDTYGTSTTVSSTNASPGTGESATADDCDDTSAAINPGVTDVPGSGADLNCDGNYLWYEDADGDGYGSTITVSSTNASPGTGESATADDCDDTAATTNPAGTDIAGSGIDANCDGNYLWYVDADGDGYGSTVTISSTNASPGTGESATADDCDDTSATINPGAADVPGSGIDANCDGNYLWYIDADDDGYGSTITVSSTNASPGTGESATADDCDDTAATTNPAGTDIAGSGIDANCDGNYLWYVDADGDGYGSTVTISSTNASPGTGESATADDCDDTAATTNPAGNDIAGSGIDANCDGNYLWYVDADGDGYGSTTTISSTNSTPGAGESANSADHNDNDPTLNPDATDVAGTGIDANGDGQYLWFVDADGDGYGTSSTISSTNTMAGAGESAVDTDCDDTDANVYPGAPALPDGKDNNCDGTIDKVAQTITFETLADIDDGSGDIVLSASSTSGLPVQYTVAGPASLSGTTLTITGAGSVSVTASQAGDVGYLPANEVTQSFCVNPVPVVDINLDGFVAVTLSSNYATGNQWYLGTEQIAGATNQTYEVSQGGFYKVEVTIDGCVGMSASADIILTGALSDAFIKELTIYPVPVVDFLYIEANNLEEGDYTLRIIDVNGKSQLVETIAIRASRQKHRLNLSHLPQGVYSVVIQQNDQVYIKKLIKR